MSARCDSLYATAGADEPAGNVATGALNRIPHDWPHREHSEFVDAGGIRWHVQRMGAGPALVLVHGTGASTHSWRDLAPLLAGHFEVLSMDLPGHAFSEALPGRRQSLQGMADAIGALLAELGCRPRALVGHSAGAAIAARMSLDDRVRPEAIVSLNGALLPLHGIAGHLFAPLARLLANNHLVARLVAAQARDPRAVRRLLDSTGSRLDPRGEELYGRLVQSPEHVAAVIAMMANWELEDLRSELPRLRPALTLVVGGSDLTVRPVEAERVRAVLPGAAVEMLSGLGHLAHEEAPATVARLIASRLGETPNGAGKS